MPGRAHCWTIALAACLVLTACGSDPERSVPGPNYANVTGAGRNLDLPSYLQRSDYPNACRLLPADTVQTLLGAAAKAGRTTSGCVWDAQSDAIPILQVAWVQIGSDASEVYTQRRVDGSSARAVADIGERARTYRVNDDQTTRVDVLKPGVFFRVEVRSNQTATHDLENVDEIATKVAQLVAEQVS